MGLLDKLKSVFFEEEEVEVEVPVKKEKVVPVAKKIETPEVKKAKEEAEKKEKEMVLEEVTEKEPPKPQEHRFPMDFDEKDFEVEEKIEPPKEEPVVEKVTLYQEKVTYDNGDKEYHSVSYQGLYEGSEQKKDKRMSFSPSPIISPIYGILDKNYKKEEIVTKKEIRLSVTPKNVDLDYVREKAYGDLANEITESMHEEVSDTEEDAKEVHDTLEDNLLYDLNDDESPAVKIVTMGDAEEYFNDLGLEYNVDYKVEKEKSEEVRPVTRRSERKKVEPLEESFQEETVNVVSDKTSKEKKKSSDDDDSNLFDLIDSMYEDKE